MRFLLAVAEEEERQRNPLSTATHIRRRTRQISDERGTRRTVDQQGASTTGLVQLSTSLLPRRWPDYSGRLLSGG